ncbi:MAG: aminotransferase class V-fold PLP-dependent enzyme [Oscillospiraceae bacterium]|nr:aminotransferase class V-fold PLP-dependent enzyme [Oscillospiraceae bacterium]
MDTPIVDFLKEYNESEMLRFHMPGHKGRSGLGMEAWDITEVSGADSLYEASGIIHRSEANAAALFGSQRTLYSTEGSSQCIRAMLHLIMSNRAPNTGKIILAARNTHKAFIYAAALLDFEICWLYPEEYSSICACPITANALEECLAQMPVAPAAVYITSPDYLGNMADIRGLSDVCHRYGTLLAVDNAHGAYLHFLPEPMHPLDLGADICCDSAHKTLPVLTGGAYLHIGKSLPSCFAEKAKSAMALFGSTSPSYLIMASLDACNAYICDRYREKLAEFVGLLERTKNLLCSRGWQIEKSDPLRLTLKVQGRMNGRELYARLREKGIEAEYADSDYVVFMLTEQNDAQELELLSSALGVSESFETVLPELTLPNAETVMSVREAIIAPSETVKTEAALGRICASPMVSCPPAIPIVISGEKITEAALELLRHYQIEEIEVVKEPE